jgi:alpha-galactosidase
LSVVAEERTLLKNAFCAAKVNGQWYESTKPGQASSDPFALTWDAGGALATARLISHGGGVVIECELQNSGSEPITFNGWRPLVIEAAGGGELHVGDEPWRASVLINGYQSWDYAGIHPLDEAVKDTQTPPNAYSWWTCAIYGPDRDAMFVAQVMKASRFATVFTWRYHRDQHPSGGLPTAITSLIAEQQGSPLSQPEQRTGMPEDLQLAVPPGSGLVSDPVLLLYGEDGTATLRRAAELAGQASGRRLFRHPPRGWCSWYHLGLAVTSADVRRNSAFISNRLPQLARTSPGKRRPVIQLDDGWMPRWQRWGDWVTNEFFAEGLDSLAASIRRRRQEAGLWLAPFHVAADSQLAANHLDWLIRNSAGDVLVDPRLDQKPYHLLDCTHPGALEFLDQLFSGLRRDGFTYFKIDFLYGGAYEGLRHDPRMTGIQALRLGLKRIFDAVNPPGKSDEAFVLACGAPLMPSVGLVHGFRIGGDTGSPQLVDGKAGPPYLGFPLILSMARNQAARLFFDRTLFAVDADVAMAAAPQLSVDEAQVMITIAALSGGIFMYSDDLETLPPDRLKLLRNPNLLELAGGPAAEPLHLFAGPELEAKDHWYAFPLELPPLWVRNEGSGGFVVAVYNWSSEPRPYLLRFAEATGTPGPYRVFDLWSPRRGGRALGVKSNRLRLQLAPHSVRLLRIEKAVAGSS